MTSKSHASPEASIENMSKLQHGSVPREQKSKKSAQRKKLDPDPLRFKSNLRDLNRDSRIDNTSFFGFGGVLRAVCHVGHRLIVI